MQPSPEQDIKTWAEALIQGWLIEKKTETLIDGMSANCSFICVGLDRVLKDKEAILQFFKEEESRYYQSLIVDSIKEMTVQLVEEHHAIINVDILIDSSIPPNQQTLTSLFLTLMIEKKQKEWKIVFFHDSMSKPPWKSKETKGIQIVNERMKQAYRTDPITGLPNMEGFCDKATQVLKTYKHRYVLIKFSIKDFRCINQRYGYSMGDTVLQNIGKNLALSCSEAETCGRIEKDMFAMLYQYKNKKEMSLRMEEVRTRLLDKKLLYELGMEIDFTAGIYIIPKSEKGHIKDMLDKALMAQQQINRHQSGSHYLYYDENMMKKQFFNNQIINYAPTAMKNEEFQLYIQPQFDIMTGKVVSGEALCRWEKEEGMFIPPNDFIPLFEDYGVIFEFDFYMLRKLCEKLQEWRQSGGVLTPISINQSRLHIANKEYIKEFCKVVDHYDIPHAYIAFELTESAFVEQYENMIKLAAELHEKGFQLAIDDFGTGFASLNLLSVVSADILKVDKSLLESIHTKRGRMVLQKVIELAHQMEMTVICEGVEEREQWQQLKELGCDLGQGYLVGRPIPADEFEKIWIKKNGEEEGL